MSTNRGSGPGNGGRVQSIPTGSRKMVQSLKEIVNCSDVEIYAALKDCNMDPNEAVNHLLSQDPFHEVKSKREKKKEIFSLPCGLPRRDLIINYQEGKDPIDSRSLGDYNNASRGNKIGADQYGGRGGLTPHYSFGNPHASTLSSVSGFRGSIGHSNGASVESKGLLPGTDDAMPSWGTHSTSRCQSTWTVAPGQVSMADIVKLGRPNSRTSNGPKSSNENVVLPTNVSHQNLRLPEDHASKDPNSVFSSVEHVQTNDEWPVIEKHPATKVVPIQDHVVHSEEHVETSYVPSGDINEHSEAKEDEETEDESTDISEVDDLESVSISTRKIPEDDSRHSSLFENDLYKNVGTLQNQGHEVLGDEEINASASSVARSLEQLNVENDDGGLSCGEYIGSVIIPDHLQVQIEDCSNLRFGSFGVAAADYSSSNITPVPEIPSMDESHAECEISSVVPPDIRSSEYYVDESLGNVSDGGLFHRADACARTDETSSVLQAEELKPEIGEAAHGNQYRFPSSNPSYNFNDTQHLNVALSQTSSQMQNLSPFSNAMLYTNALPNTLSVANAQPSRESNLHQYSPFLVSQSVSVKYGNSSVGSAISLSEALKTSTLPSSQPPQHLAVHPYSQPTVPLGPFSNMIGYPFLPQNYTYMPSAFQQTFAGNNTYNPSLAAVLPQYKSNISSSSLPQSAAAAAIASGYGSFGNSTSIPVNFPMNPPPAPSATNLNYEQVLSSQFKDAAHLASLQQTENSAMWLQGPNARTLSALPASTFYNYHGQHQQSDGGFRQGQRLSQALGYPNIYHSQTNLSVDQQQQQQPRDGHPQGQPKQSQMWQNSY